jgi:hypothetical protein
MRGEPSARHTSAVTRRGGEESSIGIPVILFVITQSAKRVENTGSNQAQDDRFLIDLLIAPGKKMDLSFRHHTDRIRLLPI